MGAPSIYTLLIATVSGHKLKIPQLLLQEKRRTQQRFNVRPSTPNAGIMHRRSVELYLNKCVH